MKIQLCNDVTALLLNFSAAERGQFAEATQEIFKVTAEKYGFPSLRSSEIYVFRNLDDIAPRYLNEPAAEFISLTVEGNFPLKFAYQLAHETGHLMSQNWKRFGKAGHHPWIEEAICGAYTIYCLRELAKIDGWWKTEGQKYLTDDIEREYPPTTLDRDWYKTNKSHLEAALGLTEIIKPLSRLIADQFLDGEFVVDNKALVDMPPMSDVTDYLAEWKSRCARESALPALLQSRLGLTHGI